MSDKRSILKEWVKGVLKEVGEVENVPGGQPAPGAGLGHERPPVVISGITHNGWFSDDSDGDFVDTVIVTGTAGQSAFEVTFPIKLTTEMYDDSDENGRHMSASGDATIVGEPIVKVDGQDRPVQPEVGTVPDEEYDNWDEPAAFHSVDAAMEGWWTISEKSSYLTLRTKPKLGALTVAVKKYMKKLEDEFLDSPEGRDLLDAKSEGEALASDPYKYYGVRRSDFY